MISLVIVVHDVYMQLRYICTWHDKNSNLAKSIDSNAGNPANKISVVKIVDHRDI